MTFLLEGYLKRIKYVEETAVDLKTLKGLQRHHLLNVPYENLDVQLQRPLDRSIEKAYQKIVTFNRGGWCYEMNGLLGWALEQIGFDVTYLAGGVGREIRGDSALGNHLVIQVHLKGHTYIVDAGFGDGFFEPVELKEAAFNHRGFDMHLGKLDDGYWRFSNHQFGGAANFDFIPEAASTTLLDTQCQKLQVDPESSFVRVLILQRFIPSGYDIQVGLIAKSVTPEGVSSRTLESSSELVERIEKDFGIKDADIPGLWPKLVESHNLFFNDSQA